ncbi:non-ribosomal peptide synthetase component F [Streptomyces sp. SAI-117]|nr:non-ribosomal peptide synthetase component F [Streptomyces sp. SAI-117]
MFLAGERPEPERLTEWTAQLPGTTLASLYGYEAAIVRTTADGASTGAARVHVLGPGLAPLPPGSVGEVYVAGACLARGYQGTSGLTAERFVPDPFGPPGTRMYRTGDLARRNAAGTLEFVGRTGRRVRVDGMWVEPAEVEARAARLPRRHRSRCTRSGGPARRLATGGIRGRGYRGGR